MRFFPLLNVHNHWFFYYFFLLTLNILYIIVALTNHNLSHIRTSLNDFSTSLCQFLMVCEHFCCVEKNKFDERSGFACALQEKRWRLRMKQRFVPWVDYVLLLCSYSFHFLKLVKLILEPLSFWVHFFKCV